MTEKVVWQVDREFAGKAGINKLAHGKAIFPASMGSPAWLPDGKQVVYKKVDYKRVVYKANWSPDGKAIVYRAWGPDKYGLHILNLEYHSVRVLTNRSDNLLYWSPGGTDVVPANDAHAVWTDDGKYIIWNSGEYGFKESRAVRQLISTLWIDLDYESRRYG